MYDAAIQNTSEHGNASKVLHAVVMENGKKLGQWISQQRGIRKGVQKPSIDIMTFEELGIERLGKSSIDQFEIEENRRLCDSFKYVDLVTVWVVCGINEI